MYILLKIYKFKLLLQTWHFYNCFSAIRLFYLAISVTKENEILRVALQRQAKAVFKIYQGIMFYVLTTGLKYLCLVLNLNFTLN